MTATLKARVTISRVSNNAGPGSIRIRIEDEASSRRVVECEMTFADFAAAVTGQGHLPATMDYVPDSNGVIGKYREMKTIGIPKPPSFDATARSSYVRKHKTVHALVKAGWAVFSDGTDRRQDGDLWSVIMVRYVEEKPGEEYQMQKDRT